MSRFNEHREAVKILKQIENNKSKYIIIHYSCESFYEDDVKSSRICSIAVAGYESKQTKLFSINSVAERKKISDIEENYQRLEKLMLREFISFVKKNIDMNWIHWNMRDSSFGFSAIEHRCKVIGVTPIEIPDSKKINLAAILGDLYGKNYVETPHMSNLFALNHINDKNYLSGADEGIAFKNHEYNKLSMSVARKVYNFDKILDLAIDNDLKVNSKRSEIYGNTLEGWYNYFHDMKHGPLILNVLNVLVGAVLGALISNIL